MRDSSDSALNGLTGDAPYIDDYHMTLWYGEQRMTPRDFQPWAEGGAPTLLLRSPLTGAWTINGVEVCVRRTVDEGKALGILSTVAIAPLAGSNGVGDLNLELQYLHAHSSFTTVNLVPGTEAFNGNQLPLG